VTKCTKLIFSRISARTPLRGLNRFHHAPSRMGKGIRFPIPHLIDAYGFSFSAPLLPRRKPMQHTATLTTGHICLYGWSSNEC